MWLPRVVDLRFPVLCVLIAAEISMGLRDHNVKIPSAVKKGESVILECNYDMEGDTLYSVKWYKGRREFYRYTPKGTPEVITFPLPGIKVQNLSSSPTQIIGDTQKKMFGSQIQISLINVPLTAGGKYACEVSADAPSFHTSIATAEMAIIETPEHVPIITGIHARYRPGDVLRGNCTSDYSRPAANLSWYINDVQASPIQTIVYRNIKDLKMNLESSILGLSFVVLPQHFIRGKLKLRCLAQIYNIYDYPVEKFIEEDRPRILATGTSGHNINFHSQPYDQSSSGGDVSELSDTELYLTHYKADVSNAIKNVNSLFLLNLILINVLVYFILHKGS